MNSAAEVAEKIVQTKWAVCCLEAIAFTRPGDAEACELLIAEKLAALHELETGLALLRLAN